MEMTNKAKVNTGGILFALLGLAGGFLSYYFPYFFLTMLLVPAFWAAVAFRSKHGAAVLIALSAATYVWGLCIGQTPGEALLILGFVAPAGILLYAVQKMKMGNANCTILLSLLMTFGFFLVFCVPSLQAYGNGWQALQLFYDDALQPLYMNASTADMARELVVSMEINYLSLLYSLGAEYALVNVLVLHLLNRRHKAMDLCPMGAFGSWRFPRRYALILVVAVNVGVLALFLGQTRFASASNLLIEMLMLPMYLMGAQTIFQLLSVRKSRKAAGWLTVLFTAILLMFGGFLLAMLGLIASLRKPVIRKEQP